MNRLIKRLALGVFAIGAIVLFSCPTCGAEPPYLGHLKVKIRCHPRVLYRGDDLVVDLESPHPNFDFGVSPAGGSLILLSFFPGKKDRIPPVIAPRRFGLMRQIRLNTSTARGSVSNWWSGEDVPRALKPPELIFTASGSYEILLGLALGAEDAQFGGCWVDYVNEEKLPGAILEDGALYGATGTTFYQNSCGARTFERAITCPARTVYRGETLAIDLVSENPASRIGIVDPDWNIYLLPVAEKPGPASSRASPGIRIVTGSETALASSYESAPSYGVPSRHVETKGWPVFTKSGWYIAMPVPGPQCERTTDVGACWIHYVDAPPPRP